MIKSHQASLNRKDSSFYSFEVGDYKDHGYIWPSKVPDEYRWVDNPPLAVVCAPIAV